MEEATTQVLIVGGGPVGMALAIELGMRGIRAVLVERSDRHSPQPRAKTTNVRSMEHLRRWGIADRLRASAPLPREHGTDVIFATRLFGHTLARFENGFFGDRRVPDDRFAEHAQWVPQYKVEAALRARVAELPSVEVRLGTRLDALAQDGDGVTATVTDLASGAPATIRAEYAIGADGARSMVREAIGARMEGSHAFAQHVNVVVRAPGLAEATRRAPAIMYWLVNPDSAALTGPMDRDDTWFFMFAQPNGAALPDHAALRARMDAAFGRAVATEILVVDPWSAHSLIADRYRQGRVILAGDACHLHPPFGGYGMNLGLGDAVDLGWKLAAVLQGWGGPRLLDSYEAERRPVHRRVIDEAVANHALLPKDLARPGLEAEGPEGERLRAEIGGMITAGKEREFRSLGVVLGSRYADSPICVADGSAPPGEDPVRFEPSAHPGCRAPHAWLAPGRSLFDLFGPGFTLLVADPAAEDGAAPLLAAARHEGVPLAVAAPGEPRLAALYGAPLVLIRPDGHVAWRGTRPDEVRGTRPDEVRGTRPDEACGTRPDEPCGTRPDEPCGTRPDEARGTRPEGAAAILRRLRGA